MSIGFVVMYPLSFLVLVICVFYLVSLARGLLIFSKNQLLVLLIFSMDFPFSISLLSTLNFYYFFASAYLGFNWLFFWFPKVEA